MGKREFLLPFIKPLEWERRSQSLYDPSSKLMLLAPHRLQRPNETQLNQHKTYRWLSNRLAITEDMPDGNSAMGKGIRLPAGELRAGLPASAQPRN